MLTAVVLALPDVIAFDMATPIDTFGRVRLPDGRPGYNVIVAGHERSVQAGPLRLAVDNGLEAFSRADLIIVPGREDPTVSTSPDVIGALQAAAARGTRLASICVGAFTLAEAGLLDDLNATTHWLAADEFARRFPRVRVDADVLYTDNGRVLTSAGAASGLDLCLHIVQRDYGAAVAADSARLAVAPLHRPGGQAQYIVRNRPTQRTSTLGTTLAWIEANAHRDLSLDDLAAAAGTSVRTLTRRFTEEIGQSPMRWVAGVRIRHAQELLEMSDHTIDRVAAQVGFPSTSNFRAQFVDLLGVTPGAYRDVFRPRASDAAPASGSGENRRAAEPATTPAATSRVG
ncbi:AraC family transcriptional regulator [Pseudoclavibacter endophyticus]|uniref:Helix-turn-helix domain-containing protein n=1 Tax=Pseudoclavibacter endophyticus TaxID=1778590 RepID=A0A6H9WEZ7_9MICO|nr:helix-turn-helix domain-containing protein [Pseudoclavibacter endophyticus]KAB1649482.1 helix-turn-helix domain-containing protein [Pseudoclavibacter endophyticus]GGA62275.1 AraC family transcriptional regulator [Pseudoclavibacter endophyticus]